MTISPPIPSDQATAPCVYFDGACPLCRVEIAHYQRLRGADGVQWVDVSDPMANPGPDLDRDAALKRFHVRTEDGTLLSGAAAFVAIWRRLPAWRWAAILAQIPGMMTLLEWGYRGFLHVRPTLSNALRRRNAAPQD